MKKYCVLKLDKCIYRDLKCDTRQISLTAVSIENYENQFFKTVFHAYPSYVFRFSFLTPLDIYKDYFKGRHKVVALVVASIL